MANDNLDNPKSGAMNDEGIEAMEIDVLETRIRELEAALIAYHEANLLHNDHDSHLYELSLKALYPELYEKVFSENQDSV